MKGEIGSVLLLFLQFLAAAEGDEGGNSRLVCLEDEVDDPPDELGDPSNFELTRFPPALPPPPPPPA